MKKTIFIAWWAVVFYYPLAAQLGNITFNHLAVEDGLSKGNNHFVYKDRTGFVWLSSVVGLNRFDGRSVKVYQADESDPDAISGENIQSTFFEDEHSNLWFTTYDGGVNKYVRATDSFEHFILKDSSGQDIVGYYAFFFEGNQKLWLIIDRSELYYFDIKAEKFIKQIKLPQKVVRANVQMGDGNKLLKMYAYSYQDKGFYLIEINSGKYSFRKYFGEESRIQLEVKSIWPVHDSMIWIGASSGLYKYNLFTQAITSYDTFNKKQVNDIYAIVPYGENNLLVASRGRGLLVFDTNENLFVELVQPDIRDSYSLTTNDLVALYLDRDNSYWVSTSQLGVDYFYPEKKRFDSFILETNVDGQPVLLKPSSMVEDENGQVWCSVDGAGICVLNKDGELIKKIGQENNTQNTIPGNDIIFLYKTKDGRIWISTWDGLAVWLPQKKKIISLPFLDKAIMSMSQLKDGRIILATFGEEMDGGLYELVEKEPLNFIYDKIEMVDPSLNYIYLWEDSRRNLFACNSLTSISVLDVENNFKLKKEILINGSVETYFENPVDNSVWVGSSTGLYHVNAELDNGQIELFTEEHGLPSRVIYGIIPDEQNRLWISTNRGLVSFELGSNKKQVFSQTDGLISTDFSSQSFFKHSSGELWFGSSGGITRFFPENVQPIKTKANPIITKILINDQPALDLKCSKTGATNISEIEQLDLDYLSNTVSFTFAALEYSDPAKTQFQYMLKGVDKDWVENGINNTARYAKIPFGNYEFHLKASNSDGVWSSPMSMTIDIAPPFYRTYWFYFFMGAGLVSSVWMVVLFRRQRREELRRLEEEKRQALEQERQRIARDVHDDLGSGLSALSLQTAMAQYKSSPEEIKSELEKINTAARDLSGKIREVIWTVSARNDTLANLISYLNRYALDLLESTEIDISVSLPDDIPDATVTGEYRRTTFLAFKEALNNMHKHARASKVEINFKTVNQCLEIEVIDNGVGFDPQLLLASTGNGLLNMRSRMNEIGGDCQFKTSNQGTKITFLLKLKPT